MNCLEKRILEEGVVIGDDILKVDGFLNHRIDTVLLRQIGEDFYTLFKEKNINKILTVEASGIAIACYTADQFKVPVVFAKKGENRNIGKDVYTAEVFSFTKGRTYAVSVSKLYLGPDDRVLIIDDFLAEGNAVLGLKSIVEQAGGTVEGVGIAITKTFQNGEKKLLDAGLDVRSLAPIESMAGGKIVFRQ
ncbi:MAG: xanthine phosphoribosyltransferase [Clostridia bacterium]|nr:xanthine phosphoribosyltransferase [Clostridia bacterium]